MKRGDRCLREAADLENVNGVIVTNIASQVVLVVRALPRLGNGAIVEGVCLVRPDRVDESRLLLLIVMEDWVFPFSQLDVLSYKKAVVNHTQRLITLGLNLATSPSRNFGVEVDDGLVLGVGVKRNIVPEGDWVAILLEPNTPVLYAGLVNQLEVLLGIHGSWPIAIAFQLALGAWEQNGSTIYQLTRVFRAPTSRRETAL